MSRLIAYAWILLGHLLARRQQPGFAAFCYGMAISTHPAPGAATYLQWGQALQASQRFSEAVTAFENASALDAANLPARLGWGKSLLQTGQNAKAVEVYAAALDIDDANGEARNGLGLAYLEGGKADRALEQFAQILETSPKHVKALNNRVAALLALGRYEEAEKAAESALAGPCREQPGLLYNLGMVHVRQENFAKAIHRFRECLSVDGNFDEAKFMLGTLLGDRALIGDSIPYLERKIAKEGRSLTLLELLCSACLTAGQLSKCAEVCEKIFEMNPESAQGLSALAFLQSMQCRQEEAAISLERSMASEPAQLDFFSGYLCFLQTVPGVPASQLFARHQEWDDRFAKPLPQARHTPPGAAASNKRIRVGYVSPDLCAHPVGFLLLGALAGRDQSQHEVFIYANNAHSDGVTRALRDHADHWCEVNGMGNEELAERIKADGIDILVELSGHTSRHRLVLMAYRAAPIQVSWIGYFHSTGLSAIDYFISDPYSTPADGSQLFSETLVHLPHTRFCFTPHAFTPEIAPLAFEANGSITFGCFNRLDKINPLVVETWARILHGVPGSRLVIKAAGFQDDLVRNAILDRFADFGIAEERLDLREREGHRAMLEQFHDIDIALDPFPFSGGMTTLECLTMGIPLVTLAGEMLVERQSVSALCNIGMPELAFESIDAYVAGAIALAQDHDRLRSLHERLRPALLASPLCDTAAFARDLDALYRRMWEAWCMGKKLPGDLSSQGLKG